MDGFKRLYCSWKQTTRKLQVVKITPGAYMYMVDTIEFCTYMVNHFVYISKYV